MCGRRGSNVRGGRLERYARLKQRLMLILYQPNHGQGVGCKRPLIVLTKGPRLASGRPGGYEVLTTALLKAENILRCLARAAQDRGWWLSPAIDTHHALGLNRPRPAAHATPCVSRPDELYSYPHRP